MRWGGWEGGGGGGRDEDGCVALHGDPGETGGQRDVGGQREVGDHQGWGWRGPEGGAQESWGEGDGGFSGAGPSPVQAHRLRSLSLQREPGPEP